MSANKRREGMRLELDKRKVLILKSIIKNYMETGERDGSRTISKHPGLNLSSATIRKEMQVVCRRIKDTAFMSMKY